ncbi:2-dehydro-3-deoxy-6-phosphogalactonate aldolase [Azospirillum sp. TSH100]|uniref:2-dehydro-3-deoxy-6-phosphogalactonate aldolase n=1 Tax=Azospirillum sp. TSH100 TaxID=652764 RepID=UPI000D611E98|nr:2-dehydro-3-deoxy-6-phosphogalactonate aldolase [Azospirillum sp. TSH100]PWC80183.1 2-dehydro-3-deoxy-6-phosphogalactonate aldolase [Azospirillum sp. TSH100]QCG90040.1 2-dehydro-3-deoxy-6-phosphogalactonate aldolase [Azospirillum sp. TSH100]
MTQLSLPARFDSAFAALPLVAILRGLTPVEAEPAGRALYDAGFRLIEVPLNSPDPFDSIAAIRDALPKDALVGAGTVLALDQVDQLADIGADLVVMPHADTAIIRAAKSRSMICVPGVATATEAFAALAAGADALKLFPAEQIAPPIVKALRAVVPYSVRLLPVGGITPDNMRPYRAAGAAGFGLGSALYSPGLPVAELATRATRFVQAWAADSAKQ